MIRLIGCLYVDIVSSHRNQNFRNLSPGSPGALESLRAANLRDLHLADKSVPWDERRKVRLRDRCYKRHLEDKNAALAGIEHFTVHWNEMPLSLFCDRERQGCGIHDGCTVLLNFPDATRVDQNLPEKIWVQSILRTTSRPSTCRPVRLVRLKR